MSRRKQARPRHLDAENELSSSLQNGALLITATETITPTATAPSQPIKYAGEQTDCPAEVVENRDDNVCGNCQQRFMDIQIFLLHKTVCNNKYDNVVIEESGDVQNHSDVLNGTSSQSSQISDVDSIEALSQNGGSDGEQEFENLDEENDEVDDDYVDCGLDDIKDAYNFQDPKSVNSMSNGEIEAEEDLKDEDDTQDSESGSFQKMKLETSSTQLTPYMLPFANLFHDASLNNLIPGSNNVMLEPLAATKAAVAQFAENNLPSSDLTELHTTLYNLQQQQIMQLQLIHQLQQQLMKGMTSPNNQTTPVSQDTTSLPASGEGSLPPSKVTSTPPSAILSEEEKGGDNGAVMIATSTTKKDLDLASLEPISTSHTPSTTSTFSLQGGIPATLKTPVSSDHNRTPKANDRGQIAAEDALFKHRCRLCHKVFGSDSALQIHFRSHTGEKPFKCNICGGRFSTRGNLKVHFQRHKSEFPHLEMNPNPVPEYLDKLPPMAMPFPGSILPMSMSSGFIGGMMGLMSGSMPPPPLHFPPISSSGSLLHPSPTLQSKNASHRYPQQSTKSETINTELKKPKLESSPALQTSEASKVGTPTVPNGSSSSITSSSSTPFSYSASALSSTASSQSSHLPSAPPSHSLSNHMIPITSIPLVSSFPITAPIPSQPSFAPLPPSIPPSPQVGSESVRPSILPAKVIDNDDSLEQFMEIDKSETSKLQQLVDNIEHKMTDPNQCVICHRVLSCKSALQMHYRIHTGERPFKCKICQRSFTTKGNLKTHMGVHRAKPPLRMMHQCPVCHKQFTNLLVLQQHIRSHTGITGLSSAPSITHMNLFSRPLPSWPHHNVTQHYPDKELDLSMKKTGTPCEEKCDVNGEDNIKKNVKGEANNIANRDEDLSDEDKDDCENNMDDMDDSIAGVEQDYSTSSNEGRTSRDGEQSQTVPKESNNEETGENHLKPVLTKEEECPHSPSPKYLQEDLNPMSSSYNGLGPLSSYSTSLAALEERVRAIDSSMAHNPLARFHTSPFLYSSSATGMINGDRSMTSPESRTPSESGSDCSARDDISNSSNSALSLSSDGTNFRLGALDLRPHGNDSRTTTTCNICLKTFACRSALDIHYRSHTRERPYKCHICDKAFTTRGNMKQHMLTHKIRDLPSQVFNNNNNDTTPNKNDKSELSDGDIKKDTPSPVSVKKEPITPSQVKKEPTEQAKSSVSSSSTPSSSPQGNGNSSNHNADSSSPFLRKTFSKHMCQICEKGFSSASALQIHIRTHTGDKPFKCNVCGKAFTTKGNLKVHMGTHMWNNSPSRRGRRMSIEPPFIMAQKDNPYFSPGFHQRGPDFYPFQFNPFLNGLPPSKISDLAGYSNGLSQMISRQSSEREMLSPRAGSSKPSGSTIHGLNNGMGHVSPPQQQTNLEKKSPKIDSPKEKERPSSSEARIFTSADSGELELDLSIKSSTPSRADSIKSPVSHASHSGFSHSSSQSSSLGWGWKASCHLCSQTFPTSKALDHHIRIVHLGGDSHKTLVS
ncbi:hypothetical protein ACJMK2_008940 [Sinanodonta woodiana]|uniref:C2H2-type domain-containing protein n=1 Tax=Sinanodonta woodiana TaxID=1069815 RepID=A0ABD3VCJ0_SINWO